MDNISAIFNGTLKTPETYLREIAQRERAVRKKMKLSREALSKKSGVSFGSLKRFEESGNISLSSLVKLAVALDCSGDLDTLFRPKKAESIEDIINGEN